MAENTNNNGLLNNLNVQMNLTVNKSKTVTNSHNGYEGPARDAVGHTCPACGKWFKFHYKYEKHMDSRTRFGEKSKTDDQIRHVLWVDQAQKELKKQLEANN